MPAVALPISYEDFRRLLAKVTVAASPVVSCESIQRGTRVVVDGRLRQRSCETREGEKRTVYEIEADEIGV